MSERNDEKRLTAAECAERTGLTVRALRVYEEYGLIAPQRTPGGWRCYGMADLIRLNTIALLKSAGLSLAQIGTATRLNEADPSLQHVLEGQVETWKAKRAEAERGERIVETALQNLRTQQSLSIDELCNLVRNLAMTDHSTDTTETAGTRIVSVDPRILDRYTGFYRWGEFAVLEVVREGAALIGHLDDVRHELSPESEVEFVIEALNAQLRFVTEGQSAATALVVHLQQGFRFEAPRIDNATCESIRERLAERLKSQIPLPGSEAALRRLLESLDAGTPDYEHMGGLFAAAIARQLPTLQAIARYLGPVKKIEFVGVGSQGWDVFEVQRQHGRGQWRVLLNSSGKIENASVAATDSRLHGLAFARPADVVDASGPTPGAEAALLRMIDGVRNGTPNYAEMSPLLAQALRQQLPQLQFMGQRLGKVLAIEYRETVVERFDIFEMKREHGATRWRISLAPDGTIASAAAVLTGTSVAAGP
jgi:DNA-binding transcriptional MerR regulator